MQQLIITILAMLSVIAPIAAEKLRKMLMSPRLCRMFQHRLLSGGTNQASTLETARADPDQFAGKPDWHNLLAYARSGRRFCIAFACRLFPKSAAAIQAS